MRCTVFIKPIQIIGISVGQHPDIIKFCSTGPASAEYPESLGEYQLLQDKYHNGFPVYQSLAKDDRYIINIGEFFVSKYQFQHFTSGYRWFITRNISDTAVKEMVSEKRGQPLVPELGWQYNNFPDCKTVR